MSLLNKMSNLRSIASATPAVTRTEMTAVQVEQCREAIKRDNRGYNVQPNRFDVAVPYRVAINFNKPALGKEAGWHNFGNFTSVDVAAAIGSIVSAAFFGEKAIGGEYDATVVETHPEYTAWLADVRNVDIIACAMGESVVDSMRGTDQVPF